MKYTPKFHRHAIDRVDSSKPYSLENICIACWSCNTVKSSVLSFDEMREIGNKYIKPKWQSKLLEAQEAHTNMKGK